MTIENKIPEAAYGILQQNMSDTDIAEAVEQVRNLGYAVLDSGYSDVEIQTISEEFNRTRKRYLETYGVKRLTGINEIHTIRSPLLHGGHEFLLLALNNNLLSMLKKLISGKFIINQQNGVINPPQKTYNQAAWHRDLPYQHFVSTRPLAVNALFCVDDFTFDNGATYVLPASHKSEAFPSTNYVRRNALQVKAKAGSFIVLDCMLFHSGGFNKTQAERRAVNHVYNIPYFKQQISIPKSMNGEILSAEEKDILGFNNTEAESIAVYLSTRQGGY